jgi:hypothetical protein
MLETLDLPHDQPRLQQLQPAKFGQLLGVVTYLRRALQSEGSW